MSNIISFENKTWQIIGTRTAKQVKSDFPDNPGIAELMEREELELLMLRGEAITVDFLIARMNLPAPETVAFRNKAGDILDPKSFQINLINKSKPLVQPDPMSQILGERTARANRKAWEENTKKRSRFSE